MRSPNKTVLFCRVTAGKRVQQYPVSVHANDRTAKAFAVMLNLAHKSGNVELMRQLDKNMPLDDQGKMFPDAKWSILEVPYEPAPEMEGIGDQQIAEPATV